MAKLKNVDEVVISGDGNVIAYTLNVPANPLKKNESATDHLYILDPATGKSTPYFTDTDVSSILFRPNHNSITFLAKKQGDENRSIYEISLNGGEAQKLFSFDTSISDFVWSSDGEHLAFMADKPVDKKESKLPYVPEIYEENLVQQRGYVTNLSEGHGIHEVAVDGSVYQMHFSPDGEKLAVSAAPTPLIDDFYMKQQVYILSHDGQETIGQVDHKGKLGQFGFSPDGKKLAMIAGADINDPIDGRLFVVSSNGGTPKNLKPDFNGSFEHFQWSDSNTLRYLASTGVWSSYGSINADGSNMRSIFAQQQPIIESFARAGNGAVAFLAESPDHPTEVYVKRHNSKSMQRLTHSNPWLKNINMGRQEVITWNARDGKVLQGLLIYPLNYEEGKRYPLITKVHGGPESHYDHGWLTSYSDPGQVAAAEGYAIFYPNYRGSTGRGVEFAMSSQGDLAGAEFDDIVDGVDHLIELGMADPEKVGVTGGSYGGYATGWMATRYTERFAAGVMFVGISDNISKWGTSDIPEELYLVHARQRIWDDYQFFLERSPIYHAGKAQTPLLIMAGKEDTRVDPGQSYELYRHIKTRTDTPVRLVLYPGEGHGNSRATARLDYNLRMMRWFNRYLKAGMDQIPDSELELQEVEIEN
ncbi:MAG: S9 family peptidase [Balneolaceae bacterium]|nr:S9 family peptidase [Balneolaceae bacterium]